MDNSQTALQSKAQEIQLEAQANTKIIEEIAGLERYISETYVSRVFYELIQNADDCNSSCFVAKKLGSNLFFLNNGTPFTCSDLESICRSAFSAKQRGVNIGYRGIGFKSTAGVAEEISIYSGNLEVYFSKNKTKKLFASDADVPLLRVPHWGSINSQIKEDAKNLLAEHSCTTCFVLNDVNTDQLLQDMRGIKSNAITFLNSI